MPKTGEYPCGVYVSRSVPADGPQAVISGRVLAILLAVVILLASLGVHRGVIAREAPMRHTRAALTSMKELGPSVELTVTTAALENRHRAAGDTFP